MLQISKSKYPLGTKVAKQFHEGKFEGELRGYNAQEDFYFILYKHGDSEDLDCVEMDQAVQEHPHQVLAMSFQLHLVTVGLRGAVAVLYSTGSSWSIRASNSRLCNTSDH
jgi:hypothetical protein